MGFLRLFQIRDVIFFCSFCQISRLVGETQEHIFHIRMSSYQSVAVLAAVSIAPSSSFFG